MTTRKIFMRQAAHVAAACSMMALAACSSGGGDGPKPVTPPVTSVLTVSTTGTTADGRVTSAPAGIDCTLVNGTQSGTCSASFTNGTAVSLTATAGAGSTFGAWGGSCSGSTTCSVTLSAATSVSATFAGVPVSITTTALAGGTVGTAYSATLAASGGNGTFAWSVTSGTLPAGLTLNASTGAISGTPTSAGTSSFSVTATSAGRTAVQALSIAVVAVVSGIEFNVLAVGTTSSCAIANTASARVYCWGSNLYGQLGIGSTDATGKAEPTLVNLPAGLSFKRVSVGDEHACAVESGGALYCWGKNTSGQVGIGSITTSVNTPTAIASGTLFTEISAGGALTCGVVDTSREARCWGNNEQGQVGDGTRVDRYLPTALSGGYRWNYVIAGQTHACGTQILAPTDVGGRARCWGRGLEGQIGDGTVQTAVTVPTAIDVSVLYLRISPGVNSNHTCGVDAAGALKCWGRNAVGQLGDGTTTSRTTPVQIASTRQFTFVSVAKDHGCAVDIAGLVFCWGENFSGVLGDGTTTSRLVPTAVSQGSATFRQVSSGNSHTCALGGTSVSRVQCWGTNVQGQLGTGSFSPGNSTTPVAVRAP